jgi:hypothetical protein
MIKDFAEERGLNMIEESEGIRAPRFEDVDD